MIFGSCRSIIGSDWGTCLAESFAGYRVEQDSTVVHNRPGRMVAARVMLYESDHVDCDPDFDDGHQQRMRGNVSSLVRHS